MPHNEYATLDADMIAALREDGSLLCELRDLFLTEAPGQLDTMAQAGDRGDANLVAQAAHRLKGTAVTFGAKDMQQLCLDIEQLAHAGSLTDVEAFIERLRVECDRVRRALDEALTAS
jgi:HPt (histidine-containing phosphotransfer) domain-containing protein